MNAEHDWITTPVTVDLLRGFLDVETTALGLLPHRLPTRARRQIPDAQLTLADGRILTGRQALDAKLIDAIGGEAEAIAWLDKDKKLTPNLPVETRFPLPDKGWGGFGKWLGSNARSALGLGAVGPVALDGLVSLWQVGS